MNNKYLLVLFFLFGINFSAKAELPPITNGNNTTIIAEPHSVAIYKDGEYHCQGSLISNRHIVSAAHCFPLSGSLDAFEVVLGKTNLALSGGITRGLVKSIEHPDYPGTNGVYDENDLTILVMDCSVAFTTAIMPITLATNSSVPNTSITSGTNVRLTGWGRNESGDLQDIIQSGTTQFIGWGALLNETDGPGSTAPLSSLFTYNDNVNACDGDSGGPMTFNGELLGIISQGVGNSNDCDHQGLISTDIRAFSAFISTETTNPIIDLFITSVGAYNANFEWIALPTFTDYNFRFREVGSADWITTNNNSTSLNNLLPGTTYELEIKPKGVTCWEFTNINFTTDCPSNSACDPCAEIIDVIKTNNEILTENAISGDLLINSGIVTINHKVEFQENSKVIVKSGAKLIIEGNGLLTKCPSAGFWQGVRIETTNSSPFGSGAGGVEIRNGGIIEYAEIGVYKSLGQGASPGTLPSLKMTSGAIIRNCETGVYFNNSGNSFGFLGEQENSIIDDAFFKENDTAIKLKFSNGLTLNRNTFEENYFGVEIINSKVDVYDNYFYDGDHIFIDAVHPSLVGINIERNVFSYGWAIRSQSTNNVDYLIVRKNTFINSDIETHGLSRFVITENDIIDNSNKSIEHCATGDGILNQVHTNYFSNNHVGVNIDGINNVEFLDNCFENTTRANIGLATNSKIRIEQGSEGREAGNNFDSGGKRLVTSDLFIESEATPEPSSRYYKHQAGANPIWDQKEPNYEYAAYDYGVEEGAFTPPVICGTGSAIYGGDFPIRHRDCTQFVYDHAGNEEALNNLISSLEDEIDRLWQLVLDETLDNWVFQTLKNKYLECIDLAKSEIVIKILSDPSGDPTYNPKDRAIEFLIQDNDFRFNIMAYSLMMNANEYVRASQYLSSLTPEREDQSDFIDVQNIYVSYLMDRDGFILSENDRLDIYASGMKRLPLAGFSRSVYYELTGERIFLDVPMYDNSTAIVKSRSNKDELSINVFPNPSQLSELININIEDELISDVNYSVSIYNTHGTVIAEKNVKRGNHKITLPELSGILFISVSRNGMIVYTDRILRI